MRMIASGTLRRAVANAIPAQPVGSDRLCTELLGIVDLCQPHRAADAAFHAPICDPADDPVFGQNLQRMDEAFGWSVEAPYSEPGFGLAFFAPHRTLTDAIGVGNPGTAESALRRFFDLVETGIATSSTATGHDPAPHRTGDAAAADFARVTRNTCELRPD
ncbi:MAG: FCD domain-containing protein [Cereibacter sp.]